MRCHDDEICVLLDGDDWLITPHCLSILNNVYTENPNILATFGSMEKENWQYQAWKKYNRKQCLSPLYYFSSSTDCFCFCFKKKFLFIIFKIETKQWLHICTDVALFTCVSELVGNNNYKFLKQKLVHYNKHNSKNNNVEGWRRTKNANLRKEIKKYIKKFSSFI